jgi:hypothetical protein
MIIKDDVKFFKDFMRYCSLKGDGYLYNIMMVKFKGGVGIAHIEDDNMASYARIIYRPEKVDDGIFWCDPSKFIDSKKGKLKSVATGDMTIEFGDNFIKGKCGRLSFKSDKDDKKEAKKVSDGAKGWGEKRGVKDGKVFGFEDYEYLYTIEIDTSLVRDAIKNQTTLTSPSYFNLLMDEDGVVSILVVDDEDTSDDPNHFSIEMGKIENEEGVEIQSRFTNSIANLFSNIGGKANVWFDQDAPLVVWKEIEMEEKGTRKRNKFELFYVLMHSKKRKKDDQLSEDDIINYKDNLDEMLEESQAAFINEEKDDDDDNEE